MFAFVSLNSHRSFTFKQHFGYKRVELNREIVRVLLFGLQQKLAWPVPLSLSDCEWRERQPLAPIDIAAQVVWIEPCNDAQKRVAKPALQSSFDSFDQNAN